MKQIAHSGIGLVLSLGLLGLPGGAQGQAQSNQDQSTSQSSSSGSSLGDYARQVRRAPPVKQKVFDNDNLPRENKLSIVGPTPASESTTAAKPEESASTAAAGTEGKAPTEPKAPADAKAATATTAKPEEDEAAKQAAWKQWGDKITAQKEQIDLLTRELDVVKREYQIRAAAMYGDVGNRMRNSGDWDKQDAQYKQQIADKQKALDDAQQKLGDMQEDARKAGVPASVREP